jgi:hypothetical protein
MFSGELKNLLIQVITSWQVLLVTGILVVYIFLVNYTARVYRRGHNRIRPSGKKAKAEEPNAAPAGQPSGDDELGLEEKTGE